MAVTVCATGAAYLMAIHVSKIARKRQQEVTSDYTSSFLSSKPNPSSSSIDDPPQYTEADHTSSAVVRDEEQSLPASQTLTDTTHSDAPQHRVEDVSSDRNMALGVLTLLSCQMVVGWAWRTALKGVLWEFTSGEEFCFATGISMLFGALFVTLRKVRGAVLGNSLWWYVLTELIKGGFTAFVGWVWNDAVQNAIGRDLVVHQDSHIESWKKKERVVATFAYALAMTLLGVIIMASMRVTAVQQGQGGWRDVIEEEFKLVTRTLGWVTGWAWSNALQYFRDNLPLDNSVQKRALFAVLTATFVGFFVIPILQWVTNKFRRYEGGWRLGRLSFDLGAFGKSACDLELTVWSVIVGRAFKYTLEDTFRYLLQFGVPVWAVVMSFTLVTNLCIAAACVDCGNTFYTHLFSYFV